MQPAYHICKFGYHNNVITIKTPYLIQFKYCEYNNNCTDRAHMPRVKSILISK